MTDRLSTDTVAERERLDYWQSVCAGLIGPVELRDYEADGFDATIDLSTVGNLKIGRFTGVHQTLERKPSLIRPGDVDDYIVLLESGNTFNIDHCGHQRSGNGGIVLIDTARPYFTNHPERLDVIDVFVPRALIEQALGPIRHAAGLCIESTQPSFPILSGFLRALAEHGARLDAAGAQRMAAVAVDLIAAGFAERIEQAPPRRSAGAATLYRAKVYIDARLGARSLGLGEVAAAVNLSVRRLHQIMAEEEVSLVDWMWERRLARARAMLAAPASRSVTVGTVAETWGFVDQAHFSRRFKARYGQAPAAFKAEQAGLAPERPTPSPRPS